MAKEDLIQEEFNQHPKKEFNGWLWAQTAKTFNEVSEYTQQKLGDIFENINNKIFTKKEGQEENTNAEE